MQEVNKRKDRVNARKATHHLLYLDLWRLLCLYCSRYLVLPLLRALSPSSLSRRFLSLQHRGSLPLGPTSFKDPVFDLVPSESSGKRQGLRLTRKNVARKGRGRCSGYSAFIFTRIRQYRICWNEGSSRGGGMNPPCYSVPSSIAKASYM